ncbi:GFA family protein [Pelagibacterium sp. H642]|uniref:GFA family protein n=1 Tax=Pelagibacterium sp. H642 TaxID=1881069 RepID=UPI00281699A6|nr:GFA family protein [Pelagibacterium sp. H642]WMT92715.1 GFA family protein [Pelagibacterium sp. H642]
MSKIEMHGSCHCGAVTFTVRVDPSAPTIRCNCSICSKSRTWIALVSANDFALTTGADRLTPYRFGSESITHCFCSKCGIKSHGIINGDPGEEAGIAVCVATLDIGPDDFGRLPVVYSDGLHDRPELEPAVVSYL